MNEQPEPDGVWPVQEDDLPGTETLEEIGASLDRQFDLMQKQRQNREIRIQQTEYFAKKIIVICLVIALVCVLAIILFLIIYACLPAIEKVLHALIQS